MSGGLLPANSTVVSAFQSALLHQALYVVGIVFILAVAWNLLRSLELRRAAAADANVGVGSEAAPRVRPAPTPQAARAVRQPETPLEIWGENEPSGRRLLRIGFGLLWMFDGILQGQTSMPLGMTTSAIEPTARASPDFVQHIVGFGVTIWNDHPVVVAVAVVWIQLGIGMWLVVAPRGYWSRAAGLVSVAWALVVWVFGEAFGALFAPGVSWLFGAPGAALFYCFAGVLIALGDRRWADGRLGQAILRSMGVFFLVMAGLQGWPGRGFWQGTGSHARPAGSLFGMVRDMAATPQPHLFSSWLSSFASFDSAHGFAVNLFVVIVLALIGFGLLASRPEIVRWTTVTAVVTCMADWILVQDLGFFGGTGTDPNSMIPIALLVAAGYVAFTRTVVTVEAEVLDPELHLTANLEPAFALAPSSAPGPRGPRPAWRERVRARPAYVSRVLAAVGAAGVVLLGAGPMAAASFEPQADQIVYRAVDGPPVAIDVLAPAFDLQDQSGRHHRRPDHRRRASSDGFVALGGHRRGPVRGRRRQPRLPVARDGASFRRCRGLGSRLELAVPDRPGGRSQVGMEPLRDSGRHRTGRRHGRSGGRRVRHRWFRDGALHPQRRSRAWNRRHHVLVREHGGDDSPARAGVVTRPGL
jgi:hypothetical protein